MLQADDLARQIVVLHREAGFMRLELPALLCLKDNVALIEAHLTGVPGVTSAAVDLAWRRISIRYDAAILSAGAVARSLFASLRELPDVEAPATAADPVDAAPSPARSPSLQPVLDKLRAALLPAEAPAEGSMQARFQPLVESALTEKAIINFFNDIVAFYLIRVHWDLITKRWLQNPVAHSNAWLTVFYFVFLLVRYRKS